MALKPTIYKAQIELADSDRNCYESLSLTLAKHPSETDERMMLRLLAFAHNSDEQLSFGKGLSSDEEPDLWRRSLASEIEQWIEMGMPSEDRCRKASQRAQQAIIYSYGTANNVELWWKKIANNLERFKNLTVYRIEDTASSALAQMANSNMSLQITIDDGELFVSDEQQMLTIKPILLKGVE